MASVLHKKFSYLAAQKPLFPDGACYRQAYLLFTTVFQEHAYVALNAHPPDEVTAEFAGEHQPCRLGKAF